MGKREVYDESGKDRRGEKCVNKTIKKMVSNDGMTLIEILLSIVILTIVVLSFSTMFIQSARTNQQTESRMDATYATQKYMEEVITHCSSDSNSKSSCIVSNGRWEGEKDNYGVIITIESRVEGGSKAVVEVFSADNGKREARMETIIK